MQAHFGLLLTSRYRCNHLSLRRNTAVVNIRSHALQNINKNNTVIIISQ